jgi:gluconolactonase
MKKILLLLLLVFSCQKNHYLRRDLTAENLFSQNIEGPAFDAEGNLYVVNYQRDGTIGQVDIQTGQCTLWTELPKGSTANSIQFDSRGDMLLADFTGHNVLKINKKTRIVTVFCHQDDFNQPNDLCINRRDQVFASDPHWKTGTGKIWRIDADGKATCLRTNMGTTNGICLSPNERILYVNESVQRKIWAFDIDVEGQLGAQRLFAQFNDFGLDGMKTDQKGNLYVTRYGKGSIVVLDSQGNQIKEIFLRGKNASNIVLYKKQAFVTLQDRKCLETFAY